MRDDTQPAQVTLFDDPPTSTRVINGACQIREQDGVCTLFLHSIPADWWHRDDKVAERRVAVSLLELGHASAVAISEALDTSLRTVFRSRQAYVEQGAHGLVPKKRGPKGARVGTAREASIARWYEEGIGNREMARRLHISEGTIRNTLRRLGLPGRSGPPPPEQLELAPELPEVTDEVVDTARPEFTVFEPQNTVQSEPAEAAESELADAAGSELADAVQGEPVEANEAEPEWHPDTLDSDPDYRVNDRMAAYEGELVDAAPFFANRSGLARVGALLVVPLIVQSGVLQAARQVYGDIGPAFYGLRTSIMALLFMALLRIKNPESLKCHDPVELGWLLGLDRAPEMKTIRRKLLHLGDTPEATEAFLSRLLQRRVAAREQALGFLYVDGHVRVYTGKADLPKAHVARMRISMPATQEVWVNDAEGSPLFFVTQQAHGQLVSELPGVLAMVRQELGDGRRVTVVFDRGGWSPTLFARMDADGFDVLTYRKGKVDPVAAELFTQVEAPDSNGREHYDLADTEVVVGAKRLAMRQVTRRTVGRKGNEHQTHIVTTRRDLPAVQVAFRMFERWRQENFFKYMRQEFAIDTLVQYGTEPADADRDVPNPAYKAATKVLAAARVELRKLQAEYGDALANNPESKRRTVRGLKIATGTQIGKPLRAAEKKVKELEAARAALPKRLPIGKVKDTVEQLARSRKRFSDGLKMLAYQLETDLVTLIAPHYKRASEDGRRLVAAAMQSRGDIEVSGNELRITLAAQSSPHRTDAIAALCAELDATETLFPGTKLRMRFAIERPDRAKWLIA